MELNKIHNIDCLEFMKTLPDKCIDLVLTDPPYGINKENAEWDKEFSLEWLSEAERVGKNLAIMCGTWNLLKMPEKIGGLNYKWTMAAHLTNGMTRGALGFGNWIPCVVYLEKYKSEPRPEVVDWCLRFYNWCKENKISKDDLNKATGFSDMGGWWASKLPHRAVAPNETNYKVLKEKFNIPESFDSLPPPSTYKADMIGDCRDFTIGSEIKPDHPSPKPLNVMRWLVDSLSNEGDIIFDPFLGSGTTAVACKELKRNYIGCEISPEYCKIAEERIKSISNTLF
jgi:site-specific DNA-methyltransferase (adenine-specific)